MLSGADGLEGLLSHFQHYLEALLDRRGDASGHRRSGVPVVGTHGTAPLLTDPAGGLMAHHLIDDLGWDAGVLQPGREGVAEVVGSAQVHGLQQRVAGRWQCQPPPVSVLTDLGDQARSHELTQGDLDRGWSDGPAAVGERGGEPVKAVRAASSEGCERAVGGGP